MTYQKKAKKRPSRNPLGRAGRNDYPPEIAAYRERVREGFLEHFGHLHGKERVRAQNRYMSALFNDLLKPDASYNRAGYELARFVERETKLGYSPADTLKTLLNTFKRTIDNYFNSADFVLARTNPTSQG